MANVLDDEQALAGVRPRSALMELLFLAGPTIAQMISYTLMQFIDIWLLARVGNGVDAPAAAGNAGLLAFTIISFGVGTLLVVNTLVSQHFGQRDYAACGRYLWQGVWFGLLFGLGTMLLLPFAATPFKVMHHEESLLAMEAGYLKIVVAASALKLVSTSFGQFLLAINRSVSVFLSSVCGVSANFVAALALVLGFFGAPRLGVVGAAWAQNIGVAVELLALVLMACRPQIRSIFHVADWKLRLPELRVLLRVGLPSGLQFVADVLAWALFTMWVMARFGTDAMAANVFMFRYMSVSFMPAIGVSIAVTALVGRYIGMGRPDLAEHRANLGFYLCAGYMLICALLFFVGRTVLIGLFTADPVVLRIGSTLMIFAAVYQVFDAVYITYSGALRGAGDTFIPAVLTAGLCWSITVFGGYVVARFWPEFGPTGPWVMATAYGMILAFFMYARFRRGGWRAIRLESGPSDVKVPDQNMAQ